MGNEQTKKKGIFDMNFKGMRIEERLKKAFNMIIIIASIGSVVGIISLMVTVNSFENATKNYALPQGDIALFMNEYAECRSSMRGIIGYEDQAEIDMMMEQHDALDYRLICFCRSGCIERYDRIFLFWRALCLMVF